MSHIGHVARTVDLTRITSDRNAHQAPRPLAIADASGKNSPQAQQVKDAFTRFVGNTFFGQLIKSMRQIQGKPAYFHGGRGEEVFQSQLDQQLADHMTRATADQIADPMFRRQFPHLAADPTSSDPGPDTADTLPRGDSLSQLAHLRRH